MLQSTIRTVRHEFGRLRRSPGFTVVAVACLALGIGANTAIFDMVHAFLLRPLPGENPQQLALITRGGGGLCSYTEYVNWRDHSPSFSGIAGFLPLSITAEAGGQSRHLLSEVVTPTYFAVFGIRPLAGRFFDSQRPPDDASAVLISARLAREILASPLAFSGANIKVNRHAFAVIGVVPDTFPGAGAPWVTDLWFPIDAIGQVNPGAKDPGQAVFEASFIGIGRRMSGVSAEQAEQATNALDVQFRREHPGTENVQLTVRSGTMLRSSPLAEGAVWAATLLSAVVALILLIACGNVATLLLARAPLRRREIAVQLALGATQGAVVRQLLVESLLLALLGGVAGLGVAFWTSKFLSSMIPTSIGGGFSFEHPLTGQVLVFGFAVSVASSVIFGLFPAFRVSRMDLAGALKSISGKTGGRSGLQQIAVVLQVALSSLVLIVSILFLRSFQSAMNVDLGIDQRNLLITLLDMRQVSRDHVALARRYDEVRRTIADLPGVRSVALSSSVPMGTIENSSTIRLEDGTSMHIGTSAIGADYFKTMGIPILRGRSSPPDAVDEVVVNESTALRLWPGQDALGKQIHVNRGADLVVVGVAKNGRYWSLGEAGRRPFMFTSTPRFQVDQAYLTVRTISDPERMARSIQKAITDALPDLPEPSVNTVPDHLGPVLRPLESGAILLSVFGGLSLVLASVGVYGILAYSIASRQKEIAIRMALGADTGTIRWLVIKTGMRLALIGLAIGMLTAVASGRVFSGVLVGIKSNDPTTFGLVFLVLAGMGCVASLFASRAATVICPDAALRVE
jgi:predicted permease